MARSGQRKQEILEAIAAMLEDPASEKITTAALAARLDVSEAALYRHFASKAQMYEGLIAFIETGLFSVIAKIEQEEASGLRQVAAMVATLLGFAKRNRGLTRVLVGDALVYENPRLQARINQLLDRVEASLRQALKLAASTGELPTDHDAAGHADALVCYAIGRWHRFVKSGFRDDPLVRWPTQSRLLLA